MCKRCGRGHSKYFTQYKALFLNGFIHCLSCYFFLPPLLLLLKTMIFHHSSPHSLLTEMCHVVCWSCDLGKRDAAGAWKMLERIETKDTFPLPVFFIRSILFFYCDWLTAAEYFFIFRNSLLLQLLYYHHQLNMLTTCDSYN